MNYYLYCLDLDDVKFAFDEFGQKVIQISSVGELNKNDFSFCEIGDYLFLFDSVSFLCCFILKVTSVSSSGIEAVLVQQSNEGVSVREYLDSSNSQVKRIDEDVVREVVKRLIEVNLGVTTTQKGNDELQSLSAEEQFINKDYSSDKLSISQLAKLLKKMYEGCDESGDSKIAAIYSFCLKYAGRFPVNESNVPKAIVAEAGMYESYAAEINKGILIYNSILNNRFGISFYDKYGNRIYPELPVIPRRTRTKYPLNRIFYGAPGTGKTHSTAIHSVAICMDKPLSEFVSMKREELMDIYNNLVSNGRISFVTFHQSYGYEDFVQGIRPDTSSPEMSFVLKDGALKTIAQKAMKNPNQDYVMIIDEINRGNISKIFGELISLLEEDKRWGEVNELRAILPSGEPFALPNNLYLIGTMNSADKSISLIDAALRRRFEFVEVVPNAEMIDNPTLKQIFSRLNEALVGELKNTDSLIGHSYFMNRSEDDVEEILNNKVIPLLYEYLYDVQNDVERILAIGLEGSGFRIPSNIGLARLRVERIS